jgi:hypothetical protein
MPAIAESLLPGGRGAPTQIDEVTWPRVRQAKDSLHHVEFHIRPSTCQ